MLKVTPLILVIFLLSACAGSKASSKNTSQDAQAAAAQEAAMAALAAMDGGGRGPASGASSSASANSAGGAPAQGSNAPAPNTPAQGGNVSAQEANRPKPAWVDSPDAVFSKQNYVSAVGYGTDRRLAERDSLGKLTGVFGQSIQADQKTIASYSEAVRNGSIQLSENSSVQNAVTTSAEMDSLVGAEIADVWYDSKSLYYAAAVMEKEKTSVLYADLIRSNERVIGDVVNMTPAVKNSLDGYSRYLLAATIADANRVYANVLTIVGNTRGINPAEMKKGEDYRQEAAAVVKNIPIGITVTGDRGDRIKSAFSKAVTGAGFRSGGNNSRYMLNVSYSMTPVELPNQPNKFVRYQINGGLADTAEGSSVLLSYDASGREGHLTIPEAEERAIRAAEQKVPQEFETVLKNYLATRVSGQK